MKIGLWIIAGLLTFMIIEKIFMEEERCREIVDAKKVKYQLLLLFVVDVVLCVLVRQIHL